MCFIQHDHAVRQIVQLAATAGAAGKQRFKQLHIGGHNNRCIPVFRCQTALSILSIGVEIAVMFHHTVAENVAVNIGGLLNNAGVGNGVNDALLTVLDGMFQQMLKY